MINYPMTLEQELLEIQTLELPEIKNNVLYYDIVWLKKRECTIMDVPVS